MKAGSVGAEFGRWADLVERDLANFRQAHRTLIERGDAARAVAIIDGLAVIGTTRGLAELADWCDATVAMVDQRGDGLELAALCCRGPVLVVAEPGRGDLRRRRANGHGGWGARAQPGGGEVRGASNP